MATKEPVLRGPNRRSTYGTLVAVGTVILTVGLLIPFLFADPASDQVLGSRVGISPGLSSDRGMETSNSTVPTPSSDPPSTTVVAGGEGGAGDDEASGTPGQGTDASIGGPDEARRASDVGITADVITVGIPVPDVAAMGDTDGGLQFGETVGDFRKQYEAAIGAVNEAGGVNGRQIVAEYRSYEAADADAMRAACIYLTEEKQVFAVLAGFFGEPILCITEQHDTPLIANAGEPDDYYARSNGNYFSVAASKDRTLRDLVVALHRDGVMAGHTIGVLDQEGVDAIPVDRSLLPALEAAGYDVAHHARIANDVGAAQSQIPLEVQRMRNAGVDTVIVATGLLRATVFAQEAQNQRWWPQYLLSDFASGATDVYTIAMPDGFEGALGYTSFRTGEARAGQPEAQHDAKCRQNYEARTGEVIDRTKIVYANVVWACGITDLFARGMAAAGVNPTRGSFTDALQNLGEFPLPFGDRGSFRPGKFDAPDSIRQVRWDLDCRCWLPTSAFAPTS